MLQMSEGLAQDPHTVTGKGKTLEPVPSNQSATVPHDMALTLVGSKALTSHRENIYHLQLSIPRNTV